MNKRERKLIRAAMSILGKTKSKAKADAARRNGRLGGKPRKLSLNPKQKEN